MVTIRRVKLLGEKKLKLLPWLPWQQNCVAESLLVNWTWNFCSKKYNFHYKGLVAYMASGLNWFGKNTLFKKNPKFLIDFWNADCVKPVVSKNRKKTPKPDTWSFKTSFLVTEIQDFSQLSLVRPKVIAGFFPGFRVFNVPCRLSLVRKLNCFYPSSYSSSNVYTFFIV